MKKPHLVVMERRDEIPVRGTCSACPDMIFAPAVMGDRRYNFEVLRKLFDEHFKKVHLREDASQAAARIVREATTEED
jgi:hypothetical protein